MSRVCMHQDRKRRDLIRLAERYVAKYKEEKIKRPPARQKTARMVYDLMVKLSRLKE